MNQSHERPRRRVRPHSSITYGLINFRLRILFAGSFWHLLSMAMSNQKHLFRRSQFEVVEPRRLMAGDLQTSNVPSNAASNPSPTTSNVVGPVYLRVTPANQSSDVNSDGFINHRDAHAVVSFSMRDRPVRPRARRLMLEPIVAWMQMAMVKWGQATSCGSSTRSMNTIRWFPVTAGRVLNPRLKGNALTLLSLKPKRLVFWHNKFLHLQASLLGR